jgi:histidine triad (HIT) family protein
MNYNKDNVFYKIINKQIPVPLVMENDHAICIKDIHPRDKIHLLVIPKGEFTNAIDFLNNASQEQQNGFWQLVRDLCNQFHIRNFKLEANGGSYADVPHFHLHIMSKDHE